MLIGCPKEIKPQEFRIGLMPGAVFELTERGHQVVMETMQEQAQVSVTKITSPQAQKSLPARKKFLTVQT